METVWVGIQRHGEWGKKGSERQCLVIQGVQMAKENTSRENRDEDKWQH